MLTFVLVFSICTRSCLLSAENVGHPQCPGATPWPRHTACHHTPASAVWGVSCWVNVSTLKGQEGAERETPAAKHHLLTKGGEKNEPMADCHAPPEDKEQARRLLTLPTAHVKQSVSFRARSDGWATWEALHAGRWAGHFLPSSELPPKSQPGLRPSSSCGLSSASPHTPQWPLRSARDVKRAFVSLSV